MGMLHIIPPALAWLWRLIAPRGFNNPSIVTGNELKSEGVGSYWPFATGKRVKQANLLLHQIVDSPNTRYVLIPNQHIGVYKVGFAAEWISVSIWHATAAQRSAASTLSRHAARCSATR